MTVSSQDIDEFYQLATARKNLAQQVRQAQQQVMQLEARAKHLYDKLPSAWRDHPFNMVEAAYEERLGYDTTYLERQRDWQETLSRLQTQHKELEKRASTLKSLEQRLAQVKKLGDDMTTLFANLPDAPAVKPNVQNQAEIKELTIELSVLQGISSLLDSHLAEQSAWVRLLQRDYSLAFPRTTSLEEMVSLIEEDVMALLE